MRRFFALTGLALVFTLFSFQSDLEGMLMDLKFGNIDQVSNHFYDYIEMHIPGENNINQNRLQARNTLKNFFNKNKIRGFEKVSERADGSIRMIQGKLTNGGNGFDIYIAIRQINNKSIILGIQIVE